MVFNRLVGFLRENIECGIEITKKLFLLGIIKTHIFHRTPINGIHGAFESMKKGVSETGLFMLDKTCYILNNAREYIYEEDNMRALRKDAVSFMFFHVMWLWFMIKDTLSNVRHTVQIKWKKFRLKESFKHLSDYRYTFNEEHTYPYRKSIEIVGWDEKEKEIKLDELQILAVKNVGSKNDKLLLREIISFCGLSRRISILEFSYISFMGHKKVWLRNE
tara:strand:- start:337 stop:993 length:657 start_codon:yes stop_codon:yes gene_type:complete